MNTRMIHTPRIQTYVCDQKNPVSIQSLWSQSELAEPFDILIEDGLHTFEANKIFFENSFHKVKPGGVYIIEDIMVSDIQRYLRQLQEWSQTFHPMAYRIVWLPFQPNPNDNCLIVIQRL